MTNFFTGIEITEKHINFFMANSSYRIKDTHRVFLPQQIHAVKRIDGIENGFYEAMEKSSYIF